MFYKTYDGKKKEKQLQKYITNIIITLMGN